MFLQQTVDGDLVLGIGFVVELEASGEEVVKLTSRQTHCSPNMVLSETCEQMLTRLADRLLCARVMTPPPWQFLMLACAT